MLVQQQQREPLEGADTAFVESFVRKRRVRHGKPASRANSGQLP